MPNHKKILITSTDVMMYLFLFPHVLFLSKNNFVIDIAISSPKCFKDHNYYNYFIQNLPNQSKCFKITADRSPFSFINLVGFMELRKLVKNGSYDIVLTNEPVMGVITRLAIWTCSKFHRPSVVYIAHGFHFYKGASVFNWIYFFIEKIMAIITDVIVTINNEDYLLAKKSFNAKIRKINGIGVNLNKFKRKINNPSKVRSDIGLSQDDIIIMSVGELLPHKNHITIINAISKIKDERVKYIICGIGQLRSKYIKTINELNIENRVILLGYRNDIPDLLSASDIFVHPSTREGLGIAAIEAMYVGLPIITSNVHGINDYSINNLTGYSLSPLDVNGFSKAIKSLSYDKDLRYKFGTYNKLSAEKYELDLIKFDLMSIINEV